MSRSCTDADRTPSARATADAELPKRIRTVHATLHSTYGALPGHAELRAEGQRHSRKRIARLMRAARPVDVSRSDLGQAREAVGVFYDRPLDWSPTMFRNLTINQAA